MRFFFAIACGAFIIAATLPAQADFVRVPSKFITINSPITITETSVFVESNASNTFRACLTFKNVSRKPASGVTFTLQFNDLLGNPIAEQVLQRSGSFGPGILIEGKMSLLGGNSDSFKNCVEVPLTSIQPSSELVGVRDVRFEDGSTWKKGDPPVDGAPGTAASPAANTTTVNVNGATGSGGVIGPVGGTFGTIAWVPGSRKLYASDVDESTQSDADYGALSKCNAMNGGGTACKIVVQISGSTNKCGAVALDEAGGRFASAHGPSRNDTIRAAQDALVKVGGTLAADSVVTVVCNTR